MVFHSAIQLEIARQLHQHRLTRTAPRPGDRWLSARLRRLLRPEGEPEPRQELERAFLIRHSRAGDESALERLAQLESRRLPEGSFLVAEVNGEIVAAAPLDVEQGPFGDPFRPTANLRRLLSLQARYERRNRDGAARSTGALRGALEDMA
jgi:hypothetical protein